VAEPELVAGRREGGAPVAAAVVGQDPLDRDPVAGVEGPGPPQEGSRRGRGLVGQLLRVGEPAVVVDRDVHPVPADAPVLVDLDPRDPVTAARPDPPEHLRVEVDELARALPLVAHERGSRLEPVETRQATPAQDRVGGRRRETRLPGEYVGSDAQLPPAGAEPRDELGRVGPGLAPDGAPAIRELAQAGPPPPLRARLAAHSGGSRRRRDRPACPDPVGQQRSAVRGQARVRMHQGSFFDCGFDTDSRG
jgi:hypothetical protein